MLAVTRRRAGRLGFALGLGAIAIASAQQTAPVVAAGYANLGARRQALVDGWIARLSRVSGQPLEPGPFYDTRIRVSSRTTFEAITHALLNTTLTDAAGTRLGDGLDLIERVDTVNGKIDGAAGDHQFRMYAFLRADALATLQRSREFHRGADNAVYHKGYPINFRAQGGPPSIQISIALDERHADVDVDYRGSSFPVALFNGHLTAANSDVRAGNNYDRHNNRWTGFSNWWRSFFGILLDRDGSDVRRDEVVALPDVPRAGKQTVDAMAYDFFTAWIVEGNIAQAMAYVSDRAYACLAQDEDDPAAFDRGMAPFMLMNKLKAAKDALGPRATLTSVMAGVRITNPALRVVTQPHHAQFVVYDVPDDVAASFDCGRQHTPGRPSQSRTYGMYYGTLFYAPGAGGASAGTGQTVALLWARERGYWKIVSWQTDPDDDGFSPPPTPAVAASTKVAGDPALVKSARDFLDRWLVRREYDAAFAYLSPAAYGCYNATRGAAEKAATAAEAGKAIRAALEAASRSVGRASRLADLVGPANPVHPAVRLVDHPDAGTFTLASPPDSFAALESCAPAERAASAASITASPEYGKVYTQLVRFRTRGGEAPVLRLLWKKEGGVWRIAAFDVVTP